MTLKRYLLFAGWVYYPGGGWEDFIGSFDTVEEAKAAIEGSKDWAHIIDKETGEKIFDTEE